MGFWLDTSEEEVGALCWSKYLGLLLSNFGMQYST